jgi:S1-C subfamily serine protease
MLRKNIIFFFLLITTFLCSCATINNSNISGILPHKSFVHFYKTTTLKSCNEAQCLSLSFRSSASGFVVSIINDGSFAITAAHFCEDEAPKRNDLKKAKIVTKYKAIRLDGKSYKAVALTYQRDIDVCLIYVKDLIKEVKPVKISGRAPKPGDKVYNLAAPMGIVGPNMVPILEGRFNGNLNGEAYYSLLAAPGSSGSMIVNNRGKLIGMVHSVFTHFPVMTMATKYDNLKNFIKVNVKKYIIYKDMTKELQLKDIFKI